MAAPIAALAVMVLATPANAQQVNFNLEELATSWSGGTKPTCEFLRAGADLPSYARVKHCTWEPRGSGVQFSQLTGTRSEMLGLGGIGWERHVADTVSARVLADSLEAGFQARGLKAYDCPNSGRRWQAPGILIQYSVGVAGADGLLHVLVFATTLPGTIPDFACPNAPKITPAEKPLPRRSASARDPNYSSRTSSR